MLLSDRARQMSRLQQRRNLRSTSSVNKPARNRVKPEYHQERPVRSRRIYSLSPSSTIAEDTLTDGFVRHIDETEARGSSTSRVSDCLSSAVVNPMDTDYRVAIDFGTTYTTIACVEKNTPPHQPRTIDLFPGDNVNNQVMRQVPTELLYLVSPEGEYKILYGYEVHRWLEGSHPQENFTVLSHVRRMKHLLDGGKDLQNESARLRQSLAILKQNRRIKSNEDIILYILQRFFEHTKQTLERDYGYQNSNTVELIFTVPVCWATTAYHIMATCINTAMRNTQFGYCGNFKNVKFFMVNEAEAGATHALRSLALALKRMETFVLVDAGGGTVDLGLYRIANENPLRLENEVNDPSGAMTGSSDLNERFLAFILRLLIGETYLQKRESIVNDEVMTWFENNGKRAFNYLDHGQMFLIRVRGLKASELDVRLREDLVVLNYYDMLAIFKPSLETIADLMERQIRSAHVKNVEVDKVVLIGGFGDSPALKEFLRQRLMTINVRTDCSIRFITTPNNTGAAGVAIGSIIRASDKRHGPARMPRQSIGIYRHLRVNEISDETILNQKSEKEGGVWLIKNTIEWVIKKNSKALDPVHRVSFTSIHSFSRRERIWKGRELLYASDECTRDGYQRTHAYNKGKTTLIGEVVFDLTHLRDQHINRVDDVNSVGAKNMCLVTVLIEMTVIDRDLKFLVRWPAEEQAAELRTSAATFTVVAAFEPGTR